MTQLQAGDSMQCCNSVESFVSTAYSMV